MRRSYSIQRNGVPREYSNGTQIGNYSGEGRYVHLFENPYTYLVDPIPSVARVVRVPQESINPFGVRLLGDLIANDYIASAFYDNLERKMEQAILNRSFEEAQERKEATVEEIDSIRESLEAEIYDETKHGKDCAICLSNFDKKRPVVKLKCGHVFDYLCLDKSICHGITGCPNCRRPIKLK